ncbi:MAG: hypothetical protein JRJ20_14240 [Deltaproteobacteria bacterium]|nr:hypothetical protein [Deltaproteobacteria bacterium]
MNTKRFILSVFLSWLLFISLDFLAHASILRSFWGEELAALKPQKDLFLLIPAGYMSFLLLTLLVGWFYTRFYGKEGSAKKGMILGAKFGGLYALSLFLGWYSFLNLPVLFLFLICLVYFIELVAVGFCFGYLMFSPNEKRRGWIIISAFFGILFLGIVLQNL